MSTHELHNDPFIEALRDFRDRMENVVQNYGGQLTDDERRGWTQSIDKLRDAEQKLDGADNEAALREIGNARQAVMAARSQVEGLLARMGDHAPAALRNALQNLSDSGLNTIADAQAAMSAAAKAQGEAMAAEGAELQHFASDVAEGVCNAAVAMGNFADKKLQAAMNQFTQFGKEGMESFKKLLPEGMNAIVQSSGNQSLGEKAKVAVGTEQSGQAIGKA